MKRSIIVALLLVAASLRAQHELPVIADRSTDIIREMAKSNKHLNSVLADLDENWNKYCGNLQCNGEVYAVSDAGSYKPIIGGAFDSIEGKRIRSLAVRGYFHDDEFEELGGGVSGSVHAIYQDGGGFGNNIYIGGRFTKAGGIPVKNIALWNDTTWTPFCKDIDSTVLAILKVGNYLYIGGNFRHIDSIEANYIARYDLVGKKWEPIIVGGVNGMDGGVAVLKNDELGNIYAGGGFTKAGDIVVNKIAKFRGSSWSALDGGVLGTNAFVSAISCTYYSIDQIGGSFTLAGDFTCSNFAHFDYSDSSWKDGGASTDGPVYAINDQGDPVIIGGDFTHCNGIVVNNMAGRAEFGPVDFDAFGSGLNGPVYALSGKYLVVSFQTGDSPIFVGGAFTTAGGKASPNFAIYEGPSGGSVRKDKANLSALKAYPNPATSSVTIELPRGARTLTLTDALGRNIRTYSSLLQERITIDVSSLAAGVYSGITTSPDGTSIAQFVITK